MLPGVNDYHTNHAAPTQPTAGAHSKFSPVTTRSPTTHIAVPDGIYNPPPASAANAAKPGPAAIGGEVRDMMELMHRREAAPFASTDAARAEQRAHENEMLSFAQAERKRRLDMEAEYERKRQLGLLDHSGLGAGFGDLTTASHAVPPSSLVGAQAAQTKQKKGNKAANAPSSSAADDAHAQSQRGPSKKNDLAAQAAAAVGSVMAPRVPAGAGDGTLHRTPEFRLASTAVTEETWDSKIRNVEQFVLSQPCIHPADEDAVPPHPPAPPLPAARVMPLPPAPPAAATAPAIATSSSQQQKQPPHYFKKQGMASTGDARHAAAHAKAKGAAAAGLVEKSTIDAAAGKATAGRPHQQHQENFTLHPPQPGDVELRSPQMIDPNEIVILPPGPFSGATASMAPFRRERGW